MTKEEVAQIITYCDENKISYKQRLSELGINAGSFYDAKRRVPTIGIRRIFSSQSHKACQIKERKTKECRIKLLHYEAGGMVIYAKMLDRGTFEMPIPGSKDVVTSSIKWEVLIYL